MLVAPSLLATVAARHALKALASFGVRYVAAYHAADPYLIAYADEATGHPWQVLAWIHGIPVYLHRTGSIPGPRPANENAPAE